MDNKILKDHFNRYKATNVVYESGGALFLTHSAALSYGNGTVRTYTRSEVFANDKKEEPAKPAKPSKPVQKLTEEQLKGMSYNDMKAYVNGHNIKVADTKKETLIAALSALIKKED